MIKWNKVNSIIKENNRDFLEYRNCPICNENNGKTLITIENFQFFTDSNKPKQVDIQEQQCKVCGAIYLNPCYSIEGFKVLFEEAGQSYGSTKGRPKEQVDWLRKYNLLKKNNVLLDIGCGSGNFLANMPKDIKKVGVDIDKFSIDIAKQKNLNIKFICSDFENFDYDDCIDVMTMFHVLEHLPNPLKTLRNLHTISSNNTKLIVEVPIIEKGNTNDINGFFSVQHLTHFSRLSFRNILLQSGWNVIEWEEQKDYNGCRVLAEKIDKISSFSVGNDEFSNVHNYLSKWYNSLKNIEDKISKLNTKKCIIWGGGMHLEFLYQFTSLFNKDIEFIILDSDKNKQNKSWRSINIYKPDALLDVFEGIPLVISSYGGQKSIENMALSYDVNSNQIIKLYDYMKVY